MQILTATLLVLIALVAAVGFWRLEQRLTEVSTKMDTVVTIAQQHDEREVHRDAMRRVLLHSDGRALLRERLNARTKAAEG